ncbi:hypothetical protein [Haloarcula rara]|uniref:hypothetical protein n=1 Tax=Haloarcula rara TaxID=3033387 RepID=UPI0023E8B0D4|nr:hypothetical protein [Halomicroarcula sp. SHR3]
MGDGTVLFGMSAVITGLLFYLLGTGKIRIRPAGWFDFVVGTSLVGYGTFMIWRGIGRFASFYPVFFLYLLGALFLVRTDYVNAAGADRRRRDLLNAALLGMPGAGGMLGVLWEGNVLFYSYLPAVPAALGGVLLLLWDTVRAARGGNLYVRDVIAAVLAVPLPLLYYFMFLFALAGMAP